MIHKLKTWPEHFAQVVAENKTFEARKDDRAYKVGDRLLLNEFNHEYQAFTGHSVTVEVTYLLTGGRFGIEPGYVVMSIRLVGPASKRAIINPNSPTPNPQISTPCNN